MIFLIDDKVSRQKNYGWTCEKFNQYKDDIIRIVNKHDLHVHLHEIFSQGNIILFHSSFLDNSEKTDELIRLKENINKDNNCYICQFSGSYCSRSVKNNNAFLPPHYLYQNLEYFIKKYRIGNIALKYLAFGENAEIEEQIDQRYSSIDYSLWQKKGKIKSKYKIAFMEIGGSFRTPTPFENAPISDWDFFEDEYVSDSDISEIISKELNSEKYDVLYIPICFGATMSDYIGLRFAMYVRLSKNVNQSTPIFLYGAISGVSEIIDNECFDALKLPNVKVIRIDYNKFKESIDQEFENIDIRTFDLDRICVNIPRNYNDNHDISNAWALYRWQEMFNWGNGAPLLKESDLTKTLYFKYLEQKYGQHDKIKRDQKENPKIQEFPKNKKIIYIDDEYDKGWASILNKIFQNSGAEFFAFDLFDKKESKEDLLLSIKEYLNNNDADCYILGLKLHSTDFQEEAAEDLSGIEIAKHIKNLNPGNQIVIFTASSDVKNLKEAVNNIGAIGYIQKESPNSNFSKRESFEKYHEFVNAIRDACKMSYLKKLYNSQKEIGSINSSTKKELDSIINLLSYKNAAENIDLLKATMLCEIIFLHNYIKSHGYKLFSLGSKDKLTTLDLYQDNIQIAPILGHLFVYRENKSDNHVAIINVSDYHDTQTKPLDGWSECRDTELTLDVSFLKIVMNFPNDIIQKYLKYRQIRNTQIAHKNGDDLKLSLKDIEDFYHDIIVPIVKKFK